MAHNSRGFRVNKVYIIMGVASVLIPLVDEFLESVDLFQPLPWPFLLFVIAGAWASYVDSIKAGALLAAAMGLLMTAMRGVVMPLLGLPLPIDERPRVGFYMGLIAVIGLVLGTLGGLPVWVLKKWRGSRTSGFDFPTASSRSSRTERSRNCTSTLIKWICLPSLASCRRVPPSSLVFLGDEFL